MFIKKIKIFAEFFAKKAKYFGEERRNFSYKLIPGLLLAAPDWKKMHWLSGRLAPPSIMGAQLTALLKPVNTITEMVRGVSEGSEIGPYDAERHQSLGQLYGR